MYVSLFSYVWIPESPRILERAADSVYHLSHLFTDDVVTTPVLSTPKMLLSRFDYSFSTFLSLFNLILLFNNLLILNIPVVTTPYKKLQQDENKANNNNNDKIIIIK